jgi:hypothetical protein
VTYNIGYLKNFFKKKTFLRLTWGALAWYNEVRLGVGGSTVCANGVIL